ncbi:hypothetical protein P153DRAFT_363422 [Dothidotthia symphoricarpi CBS 119687]|uniref:RRM domain-containing protein n=1 Tax=Dothidotthia symphoricarpi CBS 119687 TaxID=1392245 RepID=A0A6A6APX3_9PLEO|nr:uncharacterized protein P153DRAFT_363422 [Dothidotthia symphoricarpi CBS 119687]KAF2133208.1 hypothetical protein P153DRAFT_363422 [Dothidotthia symphoricarpi CBS 119687]
MSAARAAIPTTAQPAPPDENKIVRLHIAPLRPDLLKVYLAPSVLPLASNISYHSVETFPEKGFGYIELPEPEAQKLKKKLNGLTLRGSKVRIEMAKSEKRKAREEADAAKDVAEAERPPKRAKKEKRKKEDGVLEGVVLPDDRKVKRGWTEPPSKSKKDRKEKKDKDKEKDKNFKHEQKKSKYTKEPELLFKAKLTAVAATEVARKEKSKDKKEKKEKSKSKSKEVVVHEFEKNTKTPSFIKQTKISTEKKPAVEYVNGQGWVDEDGNVVEPETGKARNRRVLELVDMPAEPEHKTPASADSSLALNKKDKKAKKATPPPSSSESEADDSSVVSSSEDDESSESEDEQSEAESTASSPVPTADSSKTSNAPQASPPSEQKEVHPLEALFKRPKPSSEPTSTPTKKLAPIDTSFSFFDNNNTTTNDDGEKMEVDGDAADNAPSTPYTQKDLEWRGLRSAAPTPDTATIGRRFSFDWRKNSQDADENDDDDDDDDLADSEAEKQLSHNTKANAHLPGLAEENEDDAQDGADAETEDKPESEFRKWFWENRGDINRAWKKRRRDALKAKRLSENRKMGGARRVG